VRERLQERERGGGKREREEEEKRASKKKRVSNQISTGLCAWCDHSNSKRRVVHEAISV